MLIESDVYDCEYSYLHYSFLNILKKLSNLSSCVYLIKTYDAQLLKVNYIHIDYLSTTRIILFLISQLMMKP